MKKTLAMLLALVMILGMLPMTAFAAEGMALTLTTDAGDNLAVGDTFTVSCDLTGNTGFGAMTLALEWNEEVVAFKGFDTTNSILTAPTVNDEKAILVWDAATNNTANGNLFVANFEVVGIGECGIALREDKYEIVNAETYEEAEVTWNEEAVKELTVPEVVEAEGYTVALSPETQSKATGETAQVSIDVTHSENATFNSFDMVLSYDPAQLTLATSSLGDDKYTVEDNNGIVRIQGYGQDVAVGSALTLDFTVVDLTDDAEVTLSSAKVDIKDNAVADAPEAALGNAVAVITLGAYTVNLPEDFIGEDTVAPGEDYTFEAKDDHYDYTFDATMGGEDVKVEDNGDGTYTIPDVTGDLVIEVIEKTPKTYNVTINGEDTTGADTATYLTDYTFTLNKVNGYTYEVSVTIGGAKYTGYTVSDGSYTIPGADVTGDIVITVSKTALAADEVNVNFDGTGAGDVEGESVATMGQDYTFTVNKEDGYVYDVVVKVGDNEVEVTDNGEGTYTIPGDSVTDTITITVTKESEALVVEVNEYVKLDGKVIYLVTAAKGLAEGKVLAYDDSVMSWSEAYNAYAYLVISDTELTVEAATALITEVSATAADISYDGDINGTDLIDINDAQLVYNMYNAEYETFDTATMAMFLRADMNGDKTLTVLDSAAVVNLIA